MKKEDRDKNVINDIFGDSSINEIILEKNTLTIVFDMDTYVSPGKPFGILELKSPTNYDKLMLSQEDLPIIIHELIIVKNISKKSKLLLKIETAFCHPNDYFEIPCEDFSFKRIDEYKDKIPLRAHTME